MRKPLVFVWDNYGPMHIDRYKAVLNYYDNRNDVVAIELFGKSDTYKWVVESDQTLKKRTLFGFHQNVSSVRVLLALINVLLTVGRGHYFLCHYERSYIFAFAWLLRVFGNQVYTMNCSKFDDMPRTAKREMLKSLFVSPYTGAIASGNRSKDYYRFLGMPSHKIVGEYNTVSLDRIRAGAGDAALDIAFDRRSFVSIARFVPKKNLSMLIEAYAIYLNRAEVRRDLILCGGGPLESDLRSQIERLGLTDSVQISDFLQSHEVSTILSRGLALLLPSVEEQFGNVVIEALAMGLPVIVSDNCGARDNLVRTGINGFVVEPDNPQGLARFMCMLSDDENLWREFALNSTNLAPKGDVKEFVRGVDALLSLNEVE